MWNYPADYAIFFERRQLLFGRCSKVIRPFNIATAAPLRSPLPESTAGQGSGRPIPSAALQPRRHPPPDARKHQHRRHHDRAQERPIKTDARCQPFPRRTAFRRGEAGHRLPERRPLSGFRQVFDQRLQMTKSPYFRIKTGSSDRCINEDEKAEHTSGGEGYSC